MCDDGYQALMHDPDDAEMIDELETEDQLPLRDKVSDDTPLGLPDDD